MSQHLPSGTRIKLDCSCDAEVAMALVLVGIHRRYTVQIVGKGRECKVAHHAKGRRTVVGPSQRRKGKLADVS